MMRLVRGLIYLATVGIVAASVAVEWIYGTPTRREETRVALAFDDLKPANVTSSSSRPLSSAEIDSVWSKPIGRPIEDPPPPPAPPPPPPPPPPVQVTILGMVSEMGRSFALLEVANLGHQLVKAGDSFVAGGAEVKVLKIGATSVTLAIGSQQLVVERKE